MLRDFNRTVDATRIDGIQADVTLRPCMCLTTVSELFAELRHICLPFVNCAVTRMSLDCSRREFQRQQLLACDVRFLSTFRSDHMPNSLNSLRHFGNPSSKFLQGSKSVKCGLNFRP